MIVQNQKYGGMNIQKIIKQQEKIILGMGNFSN